MDGDAKDESDVKIRGDVHPQDTIEQFWIDSDDETTVDNENDVRGDCSKEKRPPRYTDPTIPQKHLAFLSFKETETIENADCSAVFQSLTEVLKDDIKFNYGIHNGSIFFFGQLIDFSPFGVCRVSIEILHDLVPTPDNPCQGFIEGMGVIISSKYPNLVDKALGAVIKFFTSVLFQHCLEMIQGGLVPTIISALQPHLMEPVHKPLYHDEVLSIIDVALALTSPAPCDVTEEVKQLPKDLFLIHLLLSSPLAIDTWDPVAQNDKATQFLKSLEPTWDEVELANKLVTDLVPSSTRSPSGFISMVTAALSFLRESTIISSTGFRYQLMESDLISKLIATVQPHTLPISGNETMIDSLNSIITSHLTLTLPSNLRELGITNTAITLHYREVFFQKVMVPSSQFVLFLISNRHILNEDLIGSSMTLLLTLLEISPYHQSTLEFVLASPIVMFFSSCLSLVQQNSLLCALSIIIEFTLNEWKTEGAEVVQSGKRMMQALFSEGFEDTLEQKSIHHSHDFYGPQFVECYRSVLQLLGSNVKRR
ncbi:hypothetical protein BLNAU_1609 [Blattamonas nauphoetae]|uniref:Uncharacterized protein n=1 Tax=Blattamonas nauphoetae TaxID=2049346 RepID=A0ABQ9YII3_9EUKA|nr:hypothetical protein BLNAU_1609 [Blattamonas nauphoetae]